jgi:outer membrane receptor protein involved in Fe transport
MNNNLTADRIYDQRDYQYVYGQGALGVKPMSQAAAIANPYFSWGPKMDGSPAVNFLGDTYPYLPAKNNFRNFYETGLRDATSVSFYGGNSKGHFRLGCSNLYLSAVIPNSNMKDQGVNLNSALNITKHLQLTLSGDYVFEEVKNRASFSDAPGNLIASTLYLANSFDIRWLKPAVNANGSELLPGTESDYFNNPYFVAYRYQNNTNRNRLTGAVTLKYTFLEGLFLQGQVTRDGYVLDLTDITPTGTGYLPGGDFTQYELDYHEMNENFLLGWTHSVWKSLTLTANAGGNSQDNVTQDFGVGSVPTLVEGIPSQNAAGPFNIPYIYTAANILEKPYTRGYAHYRVNSLYGSLDLQYKNVLFLTATARNDWFSTLSINSDNYLYPSLSGSFQFSDVLHLPKWVTYGKWRASYAQASDGASPYQNVLTYGQQGYTAGGQVLGFVSQSNIPNPNLKPVSIQEWETGFDMGFLNGRLGADVSVYDKTTSDDILPVTISPTSGYSGDYMNVGRIRNAGIEALITAVPIRMSHFEWKTSLNFADNASKVLNLGPGTSSYVISGAQARWGSEVNISNVVGLPYGQIMGFAYKRDSRHNIIYDSIGEPEQTGIVPLGSGVYKVTGGWSNEFRYRDFTFSFLLDYKFGAKIYSQTNLLLYFYGLQKTTLQGRETGYFTGKGVADDGEPNTKAVPIEQYFQDISAGGSDHIAEEFVYDASFIKLRSFSLAYTVPVARLQGTWIRGLSVSLVGRNLLTLLKHTPNIDPESSLNATNGQGLELSGYPSVRSLGCNVNVKF